MTTQPRIRHTLFHMFQQYFLEVLGTVAYERFVELLPTAEKLLVSQLPEKEEWVPARSMAVLFAAVDIHITHQMEDFGFEMGKFFVEQHKEELVSPPGAHKTGSRGSSEDPDLNLNTRELHKLDMEELQSYSGNHLMQISRVVKMYCENLSRWFQPIRVEIDPKMSGTTFSLLLMERPIGLPLFCEFFMGILVGCLDSLMIGDVTITKEKCLLEGDEMCHFSIYYAGLSPLDFL